MLMISNVRLLDPATGRDETVDIYVENDRISKIAKPGEIALDEISKPASTDFGNPGNPGTGDSGEYQVIDGTGL